MDLSRLFTTDEEIELFEDCDTTTSVVGYVDIVNAPAPSGKNHDGDILLKFILSNGRKRIPILVWDSCLIDKYSTEICSNRVVNINGAYCRIVSQTKFKKNNNIIPFELVIKENTDISFLGYYTLGGKKKSEIKKVTFDDIQAVEGLIEISGYVRTKFSQIHTRSGLLTYGLGAITNGVKKITVQIKEFDKTELEIGDYITVTGIVSGQDSLVTVFCDNMNNIKYDSEKPALPLEKVLRGARPVKRVRTTNEKAIAEEK